MLHQQQDYEPPPATPHPGRRTAISQACLTALTHLRGYSNNILEGMLWIYSPLSNSFYEMAITSLSLKKWQDQEHLQSLALMITVSAFAYMQSFALNGKRSINNTKELAEIISESIKTRSLYIPIRNKETGELNPEWPELDAKYKERIAFSVYLLFTVCLTGSDFYCGRFFTKNAPNDFGLKDIDEDIWSHVCNYFGAVAASTTCMTEGYEIWKKLRILLHHLPQLVNCRSTHVQYPLSLLMATVLGVPLAVLGGIGVLAETYTSVVSDDTLDITTDTYKKIAFYLCMPKAIGDMCFSRSLMVAAIYNFFCKISDCKTNGFFPTLNAWSNGENLSWRAPKMWLLSLILLSSWGMAGLVFFSQYAFTDEILENPKTALPYTWSDNYWFDTFTGVGTMIGDIITQATELVELIWHDLPTFFPMLTLWLCCRPSSQPFAQLNEIELAETSTTQNTTAPEGPFAALTEEKSDEASAGPNFWEEDGSISVTIPPSPMSAPLLVPNGSSSSSYYRDNNRYTYGKSGGVASASANENIYPKIEPTETLQYGKF